MLLDVEGDENPDEAEYLRDTFTPTRQSNRRSTQKSFRYDFRDIRCVLDGAVAVAASKALVLSKKSCMRQQLVKVPQLPTQ